MQSRIQPERGEEVAAEDQSQGQLRRDRGKDRNRPRLDVGSGLVTLAGQPFRILSESTVDIVIYGGKKVVSGIRIISVSPL
jgi:hypothetical protein